MQRCWNPYKIITPCLCWFACPLCCPMDNSQCVTRGCNQPSAQDLCPIPNCVAITANHQKLSDHNLQCHASPVKVDHGEWIRSVNSMPSLCENHLLPGGKTVFLQQAGPNEPLMCPCSQSFRHRQDALGHYKAIHSIPHAVEPGLLVPSMAMVASSSVANCYSGNSRPAATAACFSAVR